MPIFLSVRINLYKFNAKMIVKYNLDEELAFTTAVEMKNELYTWLAMYLKPDNSGARFRELLQIKYITELYSLL